MGRLEGKVALITGGGRGLGLAMAQRFAAEGAMVAVNDIDCDAATRAAASVGGPALVADVSDSAAVQKMFEDLSGEAGRLDILVNNAGIMGYEGREDELRERIERNVRQAEQLAAGEEVTEHVDRTVEMSDQEWRRMIAVHLDGTFYCCREGLKIMNRQNSGAIINLGSIMGTAGGAGSPHYCAAKAGILGLTRSLAREVVTRNIRVNAIAPGWIDTDMTAPLELMKPLIEAQTPMGRYGTAEDIAWAAVYLASDEAGFLTGQVISPNGGWHMSQ